MVGFRFFVHCPTWIDGGYENTHPAETRKEAKERVEQWNKEFIERGDMEHWIELLEIFDIPDPYDNEFMPEAEIEAYLSTLVQ